MSKMIGWMSLMGGTILLFYFGGLVSGTITSTLLDVVLNPQNLQNSPLMLKILSVGAAVIAVVSTFVARNQNSDFYLLFPVVTILFTFGWDFLVVYQTIQASSEAGAFIAVLIFGPMMLMYIISVLEWWRGVST